MYTESELKEGIKALDSLIQKSEKAFLNLREGSSQHTTLTRRMHAFRLASKILKEKLEELQQE